MRFQISDEAPQVVGAVLDHSQCDVALVTKKSSHLSRGMAVVNVVATLTHWWTTACGAYSALCDKQVFILFDADPISSQIGSPIKVGIEQSDLIHSTLGSVAEGIGVAVYALTRLGTLLAATLSPPSAVTSDGEVIHRLLDATDSAGLIGRFHVVLPTSVWHKFIMPVRLPTRLELTA